MGFINRLMVIAVMACAIMMAKILLRTPPIPKLKDEWWGEGKAVVTDPSIRPFKISVPDEVTGVMIQFN